MILFISSEIDKHIPQIQKHLDVDSVFLTTTSDVIDITENYLTKDINAIWCRIPKYTEYKTDNKKEILSKYMALREKQDYFLNLVASISYQNKNLFILNHQQASYYSQFKNYQLILAKDIGFSVPKTIVTQNINSLLTFINSIENDIVIKNYRGSVNFGDDYLTVPTMLISKRKIKENFDQIDLTYPSIYQEYIEKKFELRITVVGYKIFCVRIDSQNHSDTKIDFRTNFEHLQYQTHILPNDIENKIINLMKKMNLNYGCIDMIYSQNNEYVFLEINNNGQYLWLEKALNLGISKQIALLLSTPKKYKLV